MVPATWNGKTFTLPGYHPVPVWPHSTCDPAVCTAHTPEDHYGFHRDRAIAENKKRHAEDRRRRIADPERDAQKLLTLMRKLRREGSIDETKAVALEVAAHRYAVAGKAKDRADAYHHFFTILGQFTQKIAVEGAPSQTELAKRLEAAIQVLPPSEATG